MFKTYDTILMVKIFRNVKMITLKKLIRKVSDPPSFLSKKKEPLLYHTNTSRLIYWIVPLFQWRKIEFTRLKKEVREVGANYDMCLVDLFKKQQ